VGVLLLVLILIPLEPLNDVVDEVFVFIRHVGTPPLPE
jgi:hypothetical protein